MLIYIKPFCNMNYKLDKEYIVKVIGHNSSPILCYQRPFYLLRTRFARAVKKLGFLPQSKFLRSHGLYKKEIRLL